MKDKRELSVEELNILYLNIVFCRDKHQNGWLKEGGDAFYAKNGLNPCKCENKK